MGDYPDFERIKHFYANGEKVYCIDANGYDIWDGYVESYKKGYYRIRFVDFPNETSQVSAGRLLMQTERNKKIFQEQEEIRKQLEALEQERQQAKSNTQQAKQIKNPKISLKNKKKKAMSTPQTIETSLVSNQSSQQQPQTVNVAEPPQNVHVTNEVQQPIQASQEKSITNTVEEPKETTQQNPKVPPHNDSKMLSSEVSEMSDASEVQENIQLNQDCEATDQSNEPESDFSEVNNELHPIKAKDHIQNDENTKKKRKKQVWSYFFHRSEGNSDTKCLITHTVYE